MAVLWLVLASLKFWTRSDSLKRSQIGKNLLRLLAVGLGAAGMSLSYYRMPLFLGFFMAAWLAGWLVSSAVQGSRFDIGFFLRFWLAVGLLALVSAGSAGPWIPQMFSTRLFSYVQAGIDALASGSNALALLQKDYAVWLHPEYYYPPFVTGLALMGALAGLWKNSWKVWLLVFWTLFSALFRLTSLLRVPGAGMLDGFTVLIWVYIPASLVIGWAGGRLIQMLGANKQTWVRVGLLGAILGSGIFGAWQQRSLNEVEVYGLVSFPDLRAMDWIRKNTPEGALFLVEGFSNYNGNAAVGSDAGWWLPFFTRRSNNIPPQYALLNEVPIDPQYNRRVADLVVLLEQEALSTPAARQALCEWQFDYVFIGQGQGMVSLGGKQLFSPQEVLASPDFEVVYHEDGVWIFQVDQAICE